MSATSPTDKPLAARMRVFWPLALGLMVMVMSMLVIEVKHETRETHFALNQLKNTERELNEEWAQLLLEEHTQANHARVEAKARAIGMVEPLAAIPVTTTGAR